MTTTFQSVSVQELTQFLNDLEKGLENKDLADFKKLIFLLLRFLNSRLLDLLHKDSTFTRSQNIDLLKRIILAFDLLLSKEKHLLNSVITHKESTSLIFTENEPSPFILAASDLLLYEWIIEFVITYLPLASTDNEVLVILKSLLISVINLVTTKLHSLKYKAKIRNYLMNRFEALISKILQNLGSNIIINETATVVHLFSVLNDYDLRTKLLLIGGKSDIQFESYSRKLWFILKSVDLSSISKESLTLIDNLKSLTVINLTNNITLNDTLGFNMTSMVINWIVEYIQLLDDNNVSLSKFNQMQVLLNRSISYCLLRFYVFSIQRKVEYQILSMLKFEKLLSEVIHYSNVPKIILHVLMEINLHIASKQPSFTSSYQSTPFDDTEIEKLRRELISPLNDPRRLLDFITSDYDWNANQTSLIFSSLPGWFEYIKTFVSLNSTNFDNTEVLYTFINAVSNFPCLLLESYDVKVNLCQVCVGGFSLKGSSYTSISKDRKYVTDNSIIGSFYRIIIIEFLLKQKYPVIEVSPLLISAILILLFKSFSSYRPQCPALQDPIFNFTIRCLREHKNREIRLLAAKVLPLYLIGPMDSELESTFRAIFGSVSLIDFSTESGRIYLGESTIFALGALSKVCEGEFECALLIKLLDILGETNEQHVNLVYCTLLDVAASKSVTPYKLLSPYLPSIAERIVKHPRMLLKITELLGVSTKYFLSRTKEYTTPRLLEYYRRDFIQEIAEASGVTKSQLISKNLPRIIATYLCKGGQINEGYILSVLGNISPEYKGLKMKDIMVNIGGITWYILLQIQTGVDEKVVNQEQIHEALTYVGKFNYNRSEGIRRKTQGTDTDYIKILLGDHILELVQRFSENIHQIRGTKPFLEKVSSLKAIEFIITKNIAAVSTALGQISTCLQATLESPDFQLAAINCWKILIMNLDKNHLVSLFDIIISIIFQKFPIFEHRSKIVAVEILKLLFLELRDKHTKYSLYFFSVPFVEGLDKYYKLDHSLRLFMRQKSKLNHFPEFTRRLQTGNNYVVQQSLSDLINFTTKYQHMCQVDDFKDPTIAKDISELVRTLLDTAQGNRGKNNNVSTSCAKAISIIGALDPNKYNLMSMKHQIIIIHDFDNYQENCEFLSHFMEEVVIKAFWASDNPVRQLFSAFAMQKFLQVLRLDAKILSPDSQGFSGVWNNFSDIAKSTLAPLLSSKYVSPTVKYVPLEFPYYKSSLTHDRWLVDVTSNLLRRSAQIGGRDSSKAIIFETCSLLVRDHDVVICKYLLKYVALSLVIDGDDSSFDDIKTEFLSILNMNSSKLPPDRSELLVSCFQSIFEVLDYFNEWFSVTSEYRNEQNHNKQESQRLVTSLGLVKKFLDEVPMTLIAIKSSECDSFERTILYLENCYRENGSGNNLEVGNLKIIPTLQKMYSNINDFDSLGGIIKKFSTNNLAEKLRTFQYSEDWSLAQESFKILSQTNLKNDLNANNTRLLNSLKDHALYEEILDNLNSRIKLDDLKGVPVEWTMAGLEASIGSRDLNQLTKWLYVTESISDKFGDKDISINYDFSQGLNLLNSGKRDQFEMCMENVYDTIGGSLVSSLSSSFSRNFSLMVRLHTIYDLKLLVDLELSGDQTARVEVETILKNRLSNVDQSFDIQWQLLTIHHIANCILKNDSKVASILLQSSYTARLNDRLDISTKCIVKAMSLNENEANIEYAELLWAQGKHAEAIKSLGGILLDDSFKSLLQKSKSQLQYAIWLDESNHSSSATIIKEYIKSYKVENTWDKPYYELGKYYGKIMESQASLSGFYEQQTIRYFLKALALGPSFIFEALPKLITVWLDFAQKSKSSKEAERVLNQIVADIKTSIKTIPVYVWYTALTQILSRIGHLHEPSAEILVQIIANLIQTYPKHSLWYALSHLNSKDVLRHSRVAEAIMRAQLSKPVLSDEITNAKLLFSSLKRIADLKITRRSTKKLSLFADFDVDILKYPCNALVIPVRSNLEIRLPNSKHTPKSFTAFPKSSVVTFEKFDEVVNVFHSLQMPRQLTMRGSDFKLYHLMVKKDDTRKDAKVVEFTTMINRLLSLSNEARKRSLYISNYSVVPLAENLGVIEFVKDVATMKSVVSDQRKRLGAVINERKLFMKLDNAQKALKTRSGDSDSSQSLLEVYREICVKSPPVLHQWLIHQFSDPGSWFQARTLFTRSSAVMSIVGYIIGLGDRHCENILFFKKSGGVLHIDFDCLFDKGQTLPTPEIVPFRLTPNIIDAMGITGIEGSFRITCEVTASLLRENEAPLMNILETLLYDPLLDWKSHLNPEGHLRKVRRKIRGLLDEKEGLPMNVHGQVDVLIQEASSEESLSQMYGGWAPYV